VPNEEGITLIYTNLSSEFFGKVDLTFWKIYFLFIFFLLELTLLLEHYNSSLLFYVRPTSLLGYSLTSNGFPLTSWKLHL
jgi:hypothetical protein